jgi:hypothetical protein
VEENNKIKKAQFTKDEFTSAQSKINKKPTFNIELDPIVTEAAKEVQQGASHAKAVARWGPPGCGRTWLRAQPWWRQTGPTFLWRLHAAMHRMVSPTTIFRSPEPS